MAAERTFPAMGTTARVIVVTAPGARDDECLLDWAQGRIEELEDKWSRFRPGSELCRLNAAAGRPVVVSAETFDVVSRAVDAWFVTTGRYDPTILPALVAAGYDRTFADLAAFSPAPAAGENARGAPGCAEIRLAASVSTITLPDDVQLDLGGIGKGYAADIVATELLERGAQGALVDLGGDMRCVGTAPWDEGWLIDIEDPFAPQAAPLLRLALGHGAVVTTTPLKRAWRNGAHHLIDPTTGAPATTGIAAVTVVAGEAWWAEALAKAAYFAGPREASRILTVNNVTGVLVHDDRRLQHVGAVELFARAIA
jgi:thiamine biosynthesis lipoprotein